MVAEARHLGRSVWGGNPQVQALRAMPKAAGRLGKQPTQLGAADLGGGNTKAAARERDFG